MAQTVKNLPIMQETLVEKIPWKWKWQPTPVFLPGEFHGQTDPGGLQSMGSQRVGHNRGTDTRRQDCRKEDNRPRDLCLEQVGRPGTEQRVRKTGQNWESCNYYSYLYGSEQGSREGDNLVARVTLFLIAKIKTVKIHECVATRLGLCVMS